LHRLISYRADASCFSAQPPAQPPRENI